MNEKRAQDGAFLKTIATRVQSTGSIENLYECFNGHKQHVMDDKIASLFVDRILFFKNKALSSYEKEKCEELLLDLETERTVYGTTAVKAIGRSTLTLTFETKTGSIYSDCVVSIIKIAIDKFGGQRSAISTFLGIPEKVLSDFFTKNRELRSYWDEVRRKHKRLDE